ncbi:hypothetical protein [Rhodococcus sp. IEGM 1330]|uniref:hypothetical protein n=1 Tax=Rhodococcus sp. IEGM 1330 TaxID=3082225 RepID=UPI002955B707|nr:hypothetical protein [Rhodococcus sp. IEGM 1330]MDV8022316.1 hypothetical protein [Rhodococcus sp. IEGM 1330]
MTFIARGEVYDVPPYAECDLDALIVNVALPNLLADGVVAVAHLLGIPFSHAEAMRALQLPAAAGLSGAGSPVPVSGASPLLPAPQNETRN